MCRSLPREWKRELVRKFNPNQFDWLSDSMAAIVGCIVGTKYANPALAELVIAPDGSLIGRREGDCDCKELLGSSSDLERNWSRLLDAADLTENERKLADRLYRKFADKLFEDYIFRSGLKGRTRPGPCV